MGHWWDITHINQPEATLPVAIALLCTRLRLALLTHTPMRAYPTTLHLFYVRYIYINK